MSDWTEIGDVAFRPEPGRRLRIKLVEPYTQPTWTDEGVLAACKYLHAWMISQIGVTPASAYPGGVCGISPGPAAGGGVMDTEGWTEIGDVAFRPEPGRRLRIKLVEPYTQPTWTDEGVLAACKYLHAWMISQIGVMPEAKEVE